MPLQQTSGNVTADAYGGGVAAVPNYIEDVFNSYLWTTSGSNQTFTTGIDMTKGALTWIKSRSNAFDHVLQTGVGGGVLPNNALSSNTTGAYFGGNYRIAESTTGFTMGTDYYTGTPETAVVWTFRKQPKFFDVVTWTGDSVSGRTISHSLGSVPACIIVKRTSSSANWVVYHQGVNSGSNPQNYYLKLNATDAQIASTAFGGMWATTAPTATVFSVGDYAEVNESGATYVAYLFAHNAGGFGLTGTDNVISCGSFTTDSGGAASITLGYEPQWILYKTSSATGNWAIVDNMRGIFTQTSSNTQRLKPNLSDAEDANTGPSLTSTGFNMQGGPASGTVIYIAIRRGPMKVPTDATKVFYPLARTGTGSTANVTGVGFPPDLVIPTARTVGWQRGWYDKLRGPNQSLATNSTGAETTTADSITVFGQDGATYGTEVSVNASTYTFANWFLKRAPSFFDEVCAQGNYNGLSTLGTPHNLGVKPELVIQKSRNNATTWNVVDWNPSSQRRLVLNTTAASDDISANLPQATSSVFYSYFNSTHNCVNYLFASCPGVSKVGLYTGTGTTLQVNCGFTAGARFVLIKRTDSTGDWYVWDSARGIVSGNDPYLLLNSTAAEVTSTDYVDTYSAGFEISSTAPSAINASGGTFIFLAIA